MTIQHPQPSFAPQAAPPAAPRANALWQRLFQALGFALGLALLGFCLWVVATNKPAQQKLLQLLAAPWWVFAALAALSCLTILLSGLVFRATLRPIKRITVLDAFAINALCTLLGNVPFKLSLVVRTLVHRRRHHVPLPTLISWLAGTALIILASLAPPIAATFALRTVDWRWWTISILGTITLATLMVFTARLLAPPAAWHALASRLPAPAARLMRSAIALRLHAGLATLATPSAVAEALTYRAIDMAAQTFRFALAAWALGVTLSWEQAIIAGAAYFILQGAAPSGALGTREAGAAATLAALGVPVEVGAPLVLAVTAVETACCLLLGIAGAAYLRIDKLMGAGTASSTAPSTAPSASSDASSNASTSPPHTSDQPAA